MRPQVKDSLVLEHDEKGQVLRAMGPVELTDDEIQMVVWLHVIQGEGDDRVEGVGVSRKREDDVKAIVAAARPKLAALSSDASADERANAGPQWTADVRPDDGKTFRPGMPVDVFAWMWVQRRNQRGTFHVAWDERGIEVHEAGSVGN